MITFLIAALTTLSSVSFAETTSLSAVYEVLRSHSLPGDCKVTSLTYHPVDSAEAFSSPHPPRPGLHTAIEGTMQQDGSAKFKSTDVTFLNDPEVLREEDGTFTYYVSRYYYKKSKQRYDRLALRFTADGKKLSYVEVGTMVKETSDIGTPIWKEVSLLRCGGDF